MHELKLKVNAQIILKPIKGSRNDLVSDFRQLAERNGRYLGERDLGYAVVIYVAEFLNDADTITHVARGLQVARKPEETQ